MQTRDRLGWLLSGILIGMLLMVSCDVSTTAPTARPSAQAAQGRDVPTSPGDVPPDAPPNAPPSRPTGQGSGAADAYSDSMAAVFAKGNPSVVRINVAGQQGESLGTGFVIDTDGHIVTNFHVIAGSGGSVIVEFLDGEAAVADVKGTDQDADLAVIKVRDINPSILVPAELGDSSELRVGDVVMAIGNPFGENRTATAGIISAVRASKSEGGQSVFSIPGVLQTDASINPGNSGGPLFNSSGQVVGVNTFILDPSGRGANIGIGYAVPINLVKRIVPSLISNGSYTHPFLGATLAAVNSLAARQNNLPSKGVLISNLSNGGPADEAGLREGEVIVAVNGQAVLDPGDIISFLEFNTAPGDTVTVTINDGGGNRDVQVRLGARPNR